MKSINLEQFIEYQESQLVKGNHSAVAKELRGLEFKSIPRVHRLALAQLANRAKDPFTALKVLNSVLRPKGALSKPATVLEKAEYANSLHKIGAHQEASQLLESIDAPQDPQIIKLKAYSCIYLWNYAKAVPYLHQYIQLLPEYSYDQLIGNVNLLAAYISSGNQEDANNTLTSLKQDWKKYQLKSGSILEVNLLELEAQICFNNRQYEDAQIALKEAQSKISDKTSLYTMFLEKWSHIVDIHANPTSAKVQSSFIKFRQKVKQANQWGTLRELDLYWALANNDDIEVSRVYHSTQNPFYKEKIISLAGKGWKPTDQVSYHRSSLDLKRGVSPFLTQSPSLLSPLFSQAKLLNLFQVMVSDLYQPFHLGSLFSQLFPKEYFDPFHSANRVHQLIRRFRRVAEAHNWDIQIVNANSNYHLEIGKHFPLLLIAPPPLTSSKYLVLLNQLELSTENNSVTASDVETLLGCERSKAIRVLNLGISEGRLEKKGRGKNTLYFFKNQKAA